MKGDILFRLSLILKVPVKIYFFFFKLFSKLNLLSLFFICELPIKIKEDTFFFFDNFYLKKSIETFIKPKF